MNKLDPFEKLLNAKLQNNEVELNFDSWNAIEKKLPSAPKSNLYYWISAAIIIGTISAAIIYFNNNKCMFCYGIFVLQFLKFYFF